MTNISEGIQKLIENEERAQKRDGKYQSTGYYRYRISAFREALKIAQEHEVDWKNQVCPTCHEYGVACRCA